MARSMTYEYIRVCTCGSRITKILHNIIRTNSSCPSVSHPHRIPVSADNNVRRVVTLFFISLPHGRSAISATVVFLSLPLFSNGLVFCLSQFVTGFKRLPFSRSRVDGWTGTITSYTTGCSYCVRQWVIVIGLSSVIATPHSPFRSEQQRGCATKIASVVLRTPYVF